MNILLSCLIAPLIVSFLRLFNYLNTLSIYIDLRDPCSRLCETCDSVTWLLFLPLPNLTLEKHDIRYMNPVVLKLEFSSLIDINDLNDIVTSWVHSGMQMLDTALIVRNGYTGFQDKVLAVSK